MPSRPLPAQAARPHPEEQVHELSPFEINAEQDNGFAAVNAGTATRLSLKMEDVPAAYSVITREFIDAVGITNINEAILWATNGAPVGDGNGADVFGITTITNIRGVTLVNGGSSGGTSTTLNNHLNPATQDAYKLERYDFGRGPNAALFSVGANSALGGGMGAISKRARYDSEFTTIETKFGSWNYKRATIDVNRPISDKFAVRANAVWYDRDGRKDREFEKVTGFQLTGSYLLTPRTELRVEASTEHTKRNSPQLSYFDTVSGWDGVTVFREPMTDLIRGGNNATPGDPTSLGYMLNWQGATQGVDRQGGGNYVWVPGQDSIMNWQNTAFTRRADDTETTPMLVNGVLITRGSGLPFGNAAQQTTTPTTANGAQGGGGTLNMLYQINLPNDRFDRAINNSRFRLPTRQENGSFDGPILDQKTWDANVCLTHQIGTQWFFELGADVNETKDFRTHQNDFRTVRLDINQLLPNGANNPYYLTPYNEGRLGVQTARSPSRRYDSMSPTSWTWRTGVTTPST